MTLTSPAEGATIAGNAVALAATAGDDRGVTRVDWFLDGGATAIASDTNSAGGWTATWNSTSTADGPHTITARATDTGNQTANDANAVTIDNVDEVPQVTLTQPAEGATVAGTTVPLAATATDDLGVTRVDWFLDGGTTPIASDTSSAGGWTATWNSTGTSDGAHTIRARATDTTGQVANDTNDVTVDNVDELPTVTLTSPAEGAEIGGSAVALAATAGDDRGVTRVDWFLDGETTPIASDTSSADGWTATWDATSTPEGPHTITARATDTGNQSANDANAVTIDNVDELPQVTLTDPAEGATVSGDVALAATASDDEGVTRVDWFVDGGATPVASDTDPSGGWTGTWTSVGTANGPHTISVLATDTTGQTATDAHGVTLDNDIAPSVTLDQPAEGATVAGNAVPLAATASDDEAVTKVEWFVDGASTPVATDTTAGDGWTGVWNSTSVADGSHAITVTATDLDDLTATDANTVNVDNVDDRPTVSVTAPPAGARVRGTAVPLAATASDDHGVTQVEFRLDGTISLGVDSTPADGFTASWDTTLASDGTHAIRAIATDTIGQTRTSTARSVVVDNTAPTVSITAPTEGATVANTVTVTAAPVDANMKSVQFFRDGTSIGTDSSANGGWSVAWNTRLGPSGPSTLTAVATDAAGNQGSSAEVHVTVANTVVLEVPVATGTDDAEQKTNGNIVTNSDDLDMMVDVGNTVMTWNGIRFASVGLPPNATVTNGLRPVHLGRGDDRRLVARRVRAALAHAHHVRQREEQHLHEAADDRARAPGASPAAGRCATSVPSCSGPRTWRPW